MCVCVRGCGCMHVCIIHLYIFAHKRFNDVCTCMRVSVCVCMYVSVCVCMYMCVCVCMYVCDTCMYVSSTCVL